MPERTQVQGMRLVDRLLAPYLKSGRVVFPCRSEKKEQGHYEKSGQAKGGKLEPTHQ
jgi:hypothetical protein